jgi:hypothetical protein
MSSGLWHPDHPDAYYDDDPTYYDNLKALREREDRDLFLGEPEPEGEE